MGDQALVFVCVNPLRELACVRGRHPWHAPRCHAEGDMASVIGTATVAVCVLRML